ncbi:hypothetical protein, partial [Escherichia coli]|uniref:hypothetical protein n=1 Tax=Escherichia coli TaxID=562 RepID=UPI001F4A0581
KRAYCLKTQPATGETYPKSDLFNKADINKAQIYAWRKGIKTLYYIRLRQMALEGTEIEGCVSCAL